MAYRKQNGFTLIELLIVIIVLGTLSAVMLLSSLEAISTADTATIINNLTGLKKATTAWFWDNDNWRRLVKEGSKYMVETEGVRQDVKDFIRAHGAEIVKYLDNGSSITLQVADTTVPADSYCFQTLKNGKEWYMGYKFFKDATKEKDKKLINFMLKFESRASSLNLISITNADNASKAKAEKFGADKDKYVYILVLKLED